MDPAICGEPGFFVLKRGRPHGTGSTARRRKRKRQGGRARFCPSHPESRTRRCVDSFTGLFYHT